MKKKPSKHNVLKQLAAARDLHIEIRTVKTRERLSQARGLCVQYRQFRQRCPEHELALRRWEAEVKAAELALEQETRSFGEAFDLRMQVAADPEFNLQASD